MSKTTKIAGNPEVDPTLPKIELDLDGKSYSLCFTFGALAIAQKGLRSAGVECNLLLALDISHLDAERLPCLFYAALITHQPKMTVEKATELITMRTLDRIGGAVINAYMASLAEPSPEDVKPDPDQPEA